MREIKAEDLINYPVLKLKLNQESLQKLLVKLYHILTITCFQITLKMFNGYLL